MIPSHEVHGVFDQPKDDDNDDGDDFVHVTNRNGAN